MRAKQQPHRGRVVAYLLSLATHFRAAAAIVVVFMCLLCLHGVMPYLSTPLFSHMHPRIEGSGDFGGDYSRDILRTTAACR